MPCALLHVLPARDGFGPSAFGAISLCLRDFTQHSEYREQTHIAGLIDAPPYEGFAYHPLTLNKRWFERRSHAHARAVAQLAQSLHPVLIEVHNRPYLALKLTKIQPVPVALFLHNDVRDMRGCKTLAQRASLVRRLAGVFCISQWAKDQLTHGLEPALTAKVQVAYAGIDLPTDPLQHKENLLVCAARMTPDKGALLFAQALAQVLPEFPQWRGCIIGGRYHRVSGAPSAYEQQVAHAVAPVASQVTLAGFLPFDETQAVFRHAAIAVVPSIWDEAFGRTALEAMAHGCALIGSATGGMGEVMGDAGLRLEPCNSATLIHQLRALLSNENELAAQQQRSLQRAPFFDITKRAKQFDDLHRPLLGTIKAAS